MSGTYRLKGGPELQAFLEALPNKVVKGGVRAGLTAGAAVIRDEARQKALRSSGKMARAIKTGSPRVNQDGTISIRVRMAGEHGHLGVMFEYGIKPHLISVSEADIPTFKTRRGTRKASVKTINKMVERGSLIIGQTFVGPVVHHPGVAAHPFMRPALDAKAKEAIEAFAARIRSYILGGAADALPTMRGEAGDQVATLTVESSE